MPFSVVHVLSSLGRGGQERVALDLAAGQQALGHRALAVSLGADEEGPLGGEFRACGVEVIHLPKRAGFDAGLSVRLGRLFRERRLGIVHTHNPQPLIYAGVAAKATGAALIHTKHGVNPDTRGRVWLRNVAGRLADAFVAVSAPTALVARQSRECFAGRLRTIPNGIDLGRFGRDPDARETIRAELGVARDTWLVGTVGRLFTEKGHAFLLRALAPLLGDAVHLVIAGDGPEAARLAAQAASLSRGDAVHLIGPRPDIPRVMAALDLFVLSSVREGLPLVIPEAMAAGLPVIATAVGGIPGVVLDQETGYLVEYGDEPGLRRRVAELAADRALAHRLGRRGREHALARFSCARMVQDYVKLYEEVLRL